MAPVVCHWRDAVLPFIARQRVSYDPATQTVTFEYCFRNRSFWTVAAPASHTVPVTDICGLITDWKLFRIFLAIRHGYQLTICTPTGSAILHSKMENFNELYQLLQARYVPGPTNFRDNQNYWYLFIVVLTLLIGGGGFLWAINGG
ncbi:MAG: hypothetical protein ACRCZF_06610 [Gemmataceae bacterium]